MGPHATLAGRIKELRRLASFTQQDLSRASGLSRSYISRLEMGDIALPSRDKLRSLAGALRTSLDDLLQAAGFLDEEAGGTDLPDLKSYLRRRYAIHDPQILHAVEVIVTELQQRRGQPTGGDKTK